MTTQTTTTEAPAVSPEDREGERGAAITQMLSKTADDGDRTPTISEMATLDFEAYELDVPIKSPAEWATRLSDESLGMCIADQMLRMNKVQLRNHIVGLGEADAVVPKNVCTLLRQTKESLENYAKILGVANTRFLVAACAECVEQEGFVEEPADAPAVDAAQADAELRALAPKLLPMLDAMDAAFAAIQPLYIASKEAMGGEPDWQVVGTDAAMAWQDRWMKSPGYVAYEEALKPNDELDEAILALIDPLMEVPATTLDGLLIKRRIAHTQKHFDDYAIDDLDKLIAAGALDTLAATTTDRSDAALANALRAHDFAQEALSNAVNPSDEVWVEQNGGDISEAAMAPAIAARNAASDHADETWRHLFRQHPKTPQGLLQMARHAARYAREYEGIDDGPDVLTALADGIERLFVAEALGIGAAEPSQPEQHVEITRLPPVADLLAQSLTKELAAYFALPSDGSPEADIKNDRAYERVYTIVNAIERLPAIPTSLNAKALALAWIDSSETFSTKLSRDEYATDGKLGYDIRAILAGQSNAEPERTAFAGLIEPRNVAAGLDLSGQPIEALRALHETAIVVNRIGNAFTCQPCCEAGARENGVVTYNAAGEFADWLVTVADFVSEKVEREAQRRKPTGDDRPKLCILAERVITLGDRDELHAFIGDLKAEARRIARG